MTILTLLLSLAVLVLFLENSYARSNKNRVEISEVIHRSRGKSGNLKSVGKRSDNRKSYSAPRNKALTVEDDEDKDERLRHSQNAYADQNHVVGMESVDSRFSFEEKSMRLNLEGGAWKSQKADGSIEYMAFENKYTYKRVLREASGEITCGKYIYDQRHKNKNPSILYSAFIRDIPQASLIHKSTNNMFVQEFVYNNINVSWTREESIPSNFRCYTASLVIAAEGIGELDQEPLTWMGPIIGLYVG